MSFDLAQEAADQGGLRLPTSERQSAEFEYEAGGEFGVLISVYQIPEYF
jgi:hypothetical protein